MPEGFGLAKCARLLKSAEFSQVLNAKPGLVWRHQDPLFRIVSTPSDHPRLGLTIAKRLMHRAVDRNRVKRLIRESFRQHQSGLPRRDYVVFARQDMRPYPSKQLRDSLDALMQAIIDRSTQSQQTSR